MRHLCWHVQGGKHGFAARHGLGFHCRLGGSPELTNGLAHMTAAGLLQLF